MLYCDFCYLLVYEQWWLALMAICVCNTCECDFLRTSKSILIIHVPSWAGDHRAEDQHHQKKQAEPGDQQEAPVTSSDSQPTVGTPSTDYVAPYAPHDMSHAMVPHL
jgi:nuclear transcription factor Y alpha